MSTRAEAVAKTARSEADGVSIGVLAELIGYHLRRASGRFGTDFARTMEDTGVRQVTFGILSIIAANPGVNQGAVGRVLGIQRANMVALINELVDRGLVARTVSPSDRRAFELSLTSEGRALMERCKLAIDKHEKRMLSALSKEERATLTDLLQRIEA